MRWICILFFVLATLCSSAQTQVGFHAGGQYLAFDSWDQAVNTYNFNRPWGEPLPQLSLGWQAGVNVTRKMSPIWQPGLQLGYNRWSVGEDAADALQVDAHLFEALFTNDFYVFSSNEESPLAHLYARLGGGYGMVLARTSNANDGEDDNPSSFNGMSLPIVTGIGYDAELGNRFRIQPMVGLNWYTRMGADGLARALAGNAGEVDEFGQGYAFNLQVRFAWLLSSQASPSE